MFWNIIKERVSFAKRARESGLLIKKEKGRGLGNFALLLPPLAEKQGRGRGGAGGGLAGGLGARRRSGRGGKGKGE